jgi:DNA topoisomerase-6 subunit B
LLAESDARSLRQFLLTTFDGLGPAGVERILSEAGMGPRQTPTRLDAESITKLHAAMKNVNLSEGQVMQVLRYANRVPLLFQPAACAITQSVISNNWRSYGLSQSRNQLPVGPVTLMVHMASVWVPFTSESKEAIASYPEIMKELRLALQAVGRKLGMYLNQRKRVQQEGERREVFLRYLGEVAKAVASIKSYDERSSKQLYGRLVDLAKRKTAVADARFDDSGKKVETPAAEFGENVLIVENENA